MSQSQSESSGVSLIVVAYEHAEYLPDLLISIDAQERRPTHVLLCDDWSSDASRTIMSAWAADTDLVTSLMFNSENKGLTVTLNEALERVDTPYFAYISGDDFMHSYRLQRQVAVMLSSGAAMVYSDAYVVGPDGGRQEHDFIEWFLGPDTAPTDTFENLLRIGNWIPAPSVLLDTEIVRALGGYDGTLFFEDFDMWLRIAREYSFTHCDEPLVSFRRVETSLGTSKFRDDNDEWQWAKVEIRAKHFGAGRDTDRIIAETIRPWLVNLAARSQDRRRLALLFRRSAFAFPSRAAIAWALLATIPGPWLARAACRRR